MSFEETLSALRRLPIVAEALNRLFRELPPTLVYHSAAHTEDVLSEVVRFALHDKLSPRQVELLAIAAAFHDIGFLERTSDNESLGAISAGTAMDRDGGYSAEERDIVRLAILDTQVKMTPDGPRQVPTGPLSAYLLDADVSNLGREDFLEKVELVRQEVGAPDRLKFLEVVKMFLAAQRWYSPAAQALRSAGKARNVEVLQRILEKS